MPVEAASRALANEVTSYGSAMLSGLGLGLGPRIVIGKIEGDYVRLQALRPGIRNSWRPILIGRLVPAPHGSQLVGQLGLGSFVKAFSILWLGFVAPFFAGGLLGIVVELLRGDLSKALTCLMVAGIGLGFIAFFIGLTALGSKMGDNDAAFLRQWVAEHLHTPR
jgi:hypothetical protein